MDNICTGYAGPLGNVVNRTDQGEQQTPGNVRRLDAQSRGTLGPTNCAGHTVTTVKVRTDSPTRTCVIFTGTA
jgi:hypothetical protein